MIHDKEANIVYLSPKLEEYYPAFFKRFTALLDELTISYILLPETNDLWCRDYMPIQIEEDTFIQYKYYPDYLLRKQSDKKYITDIEKVCKALGYKCTKTDIILDGGNVVKVGNCIIMTDKIFKANPNYEHKGLIAELERLFKAEILLLPWDETEDYGHSDGIVKAIDSKTVLMTNYYQLDEEFAKEFEGRLKTKFKVRKLEYNVSKIDENSWCYINYLEVGNNIILPALQIEEDAQALKQIKSLFPNKRVSQIEMSEVVADGGALNCISWTCKNHDDRLKENRARFKKLLNRFKSEEELNHSSKRDSGQLPYSEEEIIFMAEMNLAKFGSKFPGIAEYYMKCLDD